MGAAPSALAILGLPPASRTGFGPLCFGARFADELTVSAAIEIDD
jgi:hypothetical protein